MNTSEFLDHVGDVVLLDLVSGMQVCTEIKEIDEVQNKVYTGKVVVFQIAMEPQNPNYPPSEQNPMQQKVNAQPYGGPFTLPHTDMSFDAAHVITLHVPVSGIEKGYLQATSGIEIAGAESIGGLVT